MKNDDEMSVRCGVSAQEVMVEFPEMVNENSIDEIGDRYFVDYASLATIVAIGGLNELHNKVKEQQKKIDELSLLINKIIDNGNTTI